MAIEEAVWARNQAKIYTDTAIAALPKGIVYKGEVDYYADLPANPSVGDCYSVKYAGVSPSTVLSGKEYIWGAVGGVNQWVDLTGNFGGDIVQDPDDQAGGMVTAGVGVGIGTVVASVDANVGTPSVVVTTSGPDDAKNISFAFHNLKGESGNRTVKNNMDPVATVDTDYLLGSKSSVSVVLPSSASPGQSICVVFYSGSTATTLSVTGSTIGTIPTPTANQRVELNILWDGTYWAVLSNTMAVSA